MLIHLGKHVSQDTPNAALNVMPPTLVHGFIPLLTLRGTWHTIVVIQAVTRATEKLQAFTSRTKIFLKSMAQLLEKLRCWKLWSCFKNLSTKHKLNQSQPVYVLLQPVLCQDPQGCKFRSLHAKASAAFKPWLR